jgi:hypothetical protein
MRRNQIVDSIRTTNKGAGIMENEVDAVEMMVDLWAVGESLDRLTSILKQLNEALDNWEIK